MTQNTLTQQVESAGGSAAVKLQAFLDGLTPDEQQAIELGLRRLVAQTDESTGDAAGYATIPTSVFASVAMLLRWIDYPTILPLDLEEMP